ncbi:MAG: thioredoxin family protein [Acidobacteriota bacterium]|nr:thioredoxin family protein [Acidobacteriota bacterium]
MIVTAPQNRRARLMSTILWGTCLSALLTGCKAHQPASPAAPIASAPATRQPVTPVPAVKKHLYAADADAHADIAAALGEARKKHKRVLLDFGGDWCGDCQVLDIYFHQQPNSELLDNHFVVVHIDVGHFDKNVDIAAQYNIPLNKGVPALAVLDSDGKLLYSQKTGEFEEIRYMQAAAVTEFLNRWKA